MDDIFDDSFDIISESIRGRILKTQPNSKLKIALKTVEKLMVDNDKDSYDSEINKVDSGVNEVVMDCFDHQVSVSELKSENDSGSCNVDKTNDNSILNFRKALKILIHLYDNVKQSTDVSKVLSPPPVPVTDLFRKYNPEASNIFDFHNTDCDNQINSNQSIVSPNDMDKMLREAIHTCLIQPNHLNKLLKYRSLSEDRLLNSFDISDSEMNSNYELLKVLFGWYFSGYYTARMELLTQSD